MSELDRFNFIKNRDGDVEARAWALRTYRIYRSCVYNKKPNFTQIPAWKPLFLESLLELRSLR